MLFILFWNLILKWMSRWLQLMFLSLQQFDSLGDDINDDIDGESESIDN